MASTEATGGRLGSGRQIRTHRPYQVAILETLLDGEAHHKDEMRVAGIRVCDPFDSLGAFQRKYPEQEMRLDEMSGQEKMDEAIRQQVEGAKILVSKAMSHLVDRGFMEAVTFDGRGDRETYRITDLGRDYIKNPVDTPPTVGKLSRSTSSRDVKEMAPCDICGKPLFVRDPSTWRYGEAWVSNRRNLVRLAKPKKRYAHGDCVKETFSEDARPKAVVTAEVRARMLQVLELVCGRFGLTPDELIENINSRAWPYKDARSVSIYLIRKIFNAPYRAMQPVLGIKQNTMVQRVADMSKRLEDGDATIFFDGARKPLAEVLSELEDQIRETVFQ